MRFFTVLATIVLATSASAGTISQLLRRQSYPPCAVSCITNADLHGCVFGDDNCLCHNEGFIESTTACLQTSCTGSDLDNAEAASRALCAAVGVQITSVPSLTPSASATASDTAAAAGATPSGASGASGASTSGTSTGTSTGSGTAKPSATSPSGSAPSTTPSAPANNGASARGASTLALLGAVGLAALAL